VHLIKTLINCRLLISILILLIVTKPFDQNIADFRLLMSTLTLLPVTKPFDQNIDQLKIADIKTVIVLLLAIAVEQNIVIRDKIILPIN